jgi:hypothetical protein
VEQQIRNVIPADQLDLVLDDIGLPQDPIDFTFGFTPNIGAFDGEILVSLNQKHHASTEKYIEKLRRVLPRSFPAMTFYFEPADMVTQILDFGLPAPIDVEVQGTDEGNFDVARDLRTKIAAIPGAVDVHLQQVVDSPNLQIDREPHTSRGVWIDAAGCGQQPFRIHGIRLRGCAKLLGRSEDEPHLHGYCADAAVPSGLDQSLKGDADSHQDHAEPNGIARQHGHH